MTSKEKNSNILLNTQLSKIVDPPSISYSALSEPTLRSNIVLDSACTTHLCTPDTILNNRTTATNPISITIPDGSRIQSTETGNLPIAALPPQATHAHVVPDLQTHSLLSLGQLCDSGCTATIDKNTIDVTYNDEIIITGKRSPSTTLWHMITPPTTDTSASCSIQHFANVAIGTTTPANIVAFYHAALFSPALSTLQKALTLGYITGIPGLSLETLKKHPPQSSAMIKGHLDQTRKNIRSTKNTISTTDKESDDLFPLELTTIERQSANYCYSTIFEPTGKMYADQTGY